mmetsp:Transcript_25584/g.59414  ORF Transcript_25584/g.59414 Transcript_25584/m.59414 type:complete len:127 (+) Transcript_25584:1-381(+)
MIGLDNLSTLPPTSKSPAILEFRRYSIRHGAISDFLEQRYSKSCLDSTSSPLITVLVGIIGRPSVLEIWRHGNGMEVLSRRSFAADDKWMTMKAGPLLSKDSSTMTPLVMDYSCSIHRPTSFSPLQ